MLSVAMPCAAIPYGPHQRGNGLQYTSTIFLVVRDTGGCETIGPLKAIFSRNGQQLYSLWNFKSLYINSNTIQHFTPPSYSPSSNGKAEIIIRVVKESLKKNCTGSFKSPDYLMY